MNAALLAKYFGNDRTWRGPCTVIIDAHANIQASGSDSIVQGGAKIYAPRMISGRVSADFACLLPQEESLLLVQTHRIRQATGEDLQQDTLIVVALQHVAAVEFPDLAALKAFGLSNPR
jgi:hypothetical protein